MYLALGTEPFAFRPIRSQAFVEAIVVNSPTYHEIAFLTGPIETLGSKSPCLVIVVA